MLESGIIRIFKQSWQKLSKSSLNNLDYIDIFLAIRTQNFSATFYQYSDINLIQEHRKIMVVTDKGSEENF